MQKLRVEQGDWIIVCDGTKALFLENIGDEKYANLQTRAVLEQKNPRTQEQGTDAPGRAVSPVGSARSAMEQTDWHEQAERTFLVEVAERLNTALNAGEATCFVIVAPPKALGVLRQAYSLQVKRAIREEVAKDLVKMPVHEIEKHLVGVPV
jgi:protein required for attachment to host cells